MSTALAAGGIVPIEVEPTVADGLAGNLEPGAVTVGVALSHGVDVLTVSEADIRSAMAFSASKMGLVLEGAGAVGVAALRAGVVTPDADGKADGRVADRAQRGAEAAVGGAPFLRSAPTAPRSTTRSPGDGEPLLLIAGCGQPAVAWHLSLVPALVAAGYQVATFDNRGVAPSSSPPAPYSVEGMAADTVALLDHLGWDRAGARRRALHGRVDRRDAGARPSRAGPVRRPDGQRQRADGLGDRHHHRRARPGPPRLRPAPALLRHRDPALPAHRRHSGQRGRQHLALDDGRPPGWPNPGRLGPVRGGAGLVDRPGPHDALARGRACPAWSWPSSTTSTRRRATPARRPRPSRAAPTARWPDRGTSASSPMPTQVAAYLIEFFAGT